MGSARLSAPWVMNLIYLLALVSPTLAACTYFASILLGWASTFLQRSRQLDTLSPSLEAAMCKGLRAFRKSLQPQV